MRFPQSCFVGLLCAFGALGAPAAAVAGYLSPAQSSPVPSRPAGPVRISAGVMQQHLLTKVPPIYPPEAKASGVQGSVVLHAMITADGRVGQLAVVQGNDAFAAAALDAVKQWTYRPYFLNGEPVEVDTVIIVNFNFDR